MTTKEQMMAVINKINFDDSCKLVEWSDKADITEDGVNNGIVKWKYNGKRTVTFYLNEENKEARP